MESGIPGLDRLCEFKSKQIILTYGPPGPEKGDFVRKFLFNGLKKGQPAVYITTDRSPAELRELFALRGWDLSEFEKNGTFHFVDAYSWTIHEKDRSPSVITIPSPSSLSEISIAVSILIQKLPHARIVFDSLSTILLYNDPTSVFRFFQVLTSKVKHFDAIMFAVLEEGMHDNKVKVTLEHLSDGTVVIETVPDHKLKIERIVNTDWIGYSMSDDGIIVLP